MIRIVRGEAPQDFLRRSVAGCQGLLKQLQCHASAATGEPFKPAFDRNVWKSARDRLFQVQHGKCAYTEATLDVCMGVEHFRPKGAVRNDRKAKQHHPGYFWLAYEWDNLLLTNPKVNNHKSDCFPLANPGKRATSPGTSLDQEKPILIDPAQECPREHIRFHQDAPRGITDRGRETIALLRLDHAYLREKRMKHLKDLQVLLLLAENPSAMAASDHNALDPEVELAKSVQPEAEFSSMAIDFLAAHGR